MPDALNDALKDAVLDGVLAHAEKDGFTPASLTRVLRERGAPDTLFPNGMAGVIAYWSERTDTMLAENLKGANLLQLPMRKRIQVAVLARLAILKPHKAAARKAALLLALPQHAGLGAELVWHSADVIWRAAGDLSTDFNYYSKRGILAGVLSSTMIAWFGDDSADQAATITFLEARIDNVMQFEKLKARVKDACSPKTGTAA
ncbi:ubiquinone biosynthesis protein COQ9 [Rhizomicrobium palustre]|uniref:Ubiquinone biosynthesis protein COQ9 n=1 Tax=Rhizomicrobium palustre TaxID=189966 RepID=A0A846MZ10_9PROT|nr:COQ9 family protein [Rhizomicrobium palustre]NIK88331.1 ubiquinone biosynthesis protein COQ9 [Rhizomicrobium palustre]